MQTAWNPSLATGVNTVDTEHQEIFRQVATMNQAMIDGKGQAELKKIIDFVDDYIVTHFSHEEKIMDDYRCPVAEANKQAHTKFIANFKTLKQKFDSKGASSSLVLDISSMISDWLINHIKQIDSQLGKCKPDAAKSPALRVKRCLEWHQIDKKSNHGTGSENFRSPFFRGGFVRCFS